MDDISAIFDFKELGNSSSMVFIYSRNKAFSPLTHKNFHENTILFSAKIVCTSMILSLKACAVQHTNVLNCIFFFF